MGDESRNDQEISSALSKREKKVLFVYFAVFATVLIIFMGVVSIHSFYSNEPEVIESSVVYENGRMDIVFGVNDSAGIIIDSDAERNNLLFSHRFPVYEGFTLRLENLEEGDIVEVYGPVSEDRDELMLKVTYNPDNATQMGSDSELDPDETYKVRDDNGNNSKVSPQKISYF